MGTIGTMGTIGSMGTMETMGAIWTMGALGSVGKWELWKMGENENGLKEPKNSTNLAP